MALGHLLVGLVTAMVGTTASLLALGPSWGTIGVYVLGGDLGLLLSASLSYVSGIAGPVDR